MRIWIYSRRFASSKFKISYRPNSAGDRARDHGIIPAVVSSRSPELRLLGEPRCCADFDPSIRLGDDCPNSRTERLGIAGSRLVAAAADQILAQRLVGPDPPDRRCQVARIVGGD